MTHLQQTLCSDKFELISSSYKETQKFKQNYVLFSG